MGCVYCSGMRVSYCPCQNKNKQVALKVENPNKISEQNKRALAGAIWLPYPGFWVKQQEISLFNLAGYSKSIGLSKENKISRSRFAKKIYQGGYFAYLNLKKMEWSNMPGWRLNLRKFRAENWHIPFHTVPRHLW